MEATESEGTGVELTIRLRGAFPDALTARRVVEAVRVDNPAFVSVEADGKEIEIRLKATSAASARATLEDLLACLRAAERTVAEGAVAQKDQ